MSPFQVRRDTAERVDASMDLLNTLYRDSVEPEYATVTERDGRRQPRWAVVGVATLAFGAMAGAAIWGNLSNAPALANERAELIDRVRAAATRQDSLRTRVTDLTEANRRLAEQALQTDPDAQRMREQLGFLEVATGIQPVVGPGVVVLVDDSESSTATGSRVVDVDLRQAVNGLWQAGAEAIAINGHRLSARTSIRGAGSAITVDYRSLTRPYRIEAIGDTAALFRDFPGTPGGAWWAYLRQNFDIRFELSGASNLRLSADPGLGLRFATRAK